MYSRTFLLRTRNLKRMLAIKLDKTNNNIYNILGNLSGLAAIILLSFIQSFLA